VEAVDVDERIDTAVHQILDLADRRNPVWIVHATQSCLIDVADQHPVRVHLQPEVNGPSRSSRDGDQSRDREPSKYTSSASPHAKIPFHGARQPEPTAGSVPKLADLQATDFVGDL